jgi:integrase
MLPGENHRERVLTGEEEAVYLRAAASDAMFQHRDPSLLQDVAKILIDCGSRPEECFRLRIESVMDGRLEIHYGKTENARRRVPITLRVKAILARRLAARSERHGWLFPADTESRHIEPSSLKKQHLKALSEATRIMREETGNGDASLRSFEFYVLRHTCLTRWAPHMDPWTLAYLAGHRDMGITKRYIHPEEHTVREAMDRAASASGGHTFGHTALSR